MSKELIDFRHLHTQVNEPLSSELTFEDMLNAEKVREYMKKLRNDNGPEERGKR